MLKLDETYDDDDDVEVENLCEPPTEDEPVMYMLDSLHGEKE